jgi:hypothetical protein
MSCLPPAAGTQQLQNALTAALRNILAGQALSAGQQAQLAAAASTAAASGAAAGTGVLKMFAAQLCWRSAVSSQLCIARPQISTVQQQQLLLVLSPHFSTPRSAN